jgi:acyl transferase domain-containing protein
MGSEDTDRGQNEIAIVGIALRFPGARSCDEFWRNLAAGVESVRTLSDAELQAAGVAACDYRDPRYVRRKGVLEGADQFDARFFDLSPLEASVMDPQHRLFLECASEALENAGYGGADRGGRVGVYAGVGLNTYWLRYVARSARVLGLLGGWQASILNDKDFVPTRVSYHLDLKGPSVSINSACSASLVAVHMACMSLLTCESDLALAGGVSVEFPQTEGILWREGMVYAPDGHCRAFDAGGAGIVDGNGVGIVVLKRLADALRDRDGIRGVILGSAVNNDGAAKVGYTAPSIEGQVDVIRQALAMAGCSAGDIRYVEAHGTATALGDPIEVAALTQAFQGSSDESQFCALGSVKTNLGHLDTAAGVAGLIKTVLCLEQGYFVPSLHFEKPNPHIDFDTSPFYVSTELRVWPEGPTPRRAGVTSLGIGGTNAHVIVQEPPPAVASQSCRRFSLFPISGKNEAALCVLQAQLAATIETGRADLADVAYTLQVGRRAFEHRRAIVASTRQELIRALREEAVSLSNACETPPSLVFLFPGQGAQHAQMSREIYDTEPVYRRELDQCAELLRARLDIDLRSFIFSTDPSSEARLRETAVAQPALFIVEYALARLWSSWGIEPDAMIGHSVGELVAACLSGVLGLDEALVLVAARGALMARAPNGAMLAVNLPAATLAELLGGGLSIAAINEPDWSVASGSVAEVSELERTLGARGPAHRRLHTSHAFHSPAMDASVEPFVREVARCTLRPPRIPFISNVTGAYIEPAMAMSPSYWGQQLRQTVRFSAGLSTLLGDGAARTFLELGPGQALSKMVQRHPQKGRAVAAVPSLPHESARASEQRTLLEAAGELWERGHPIDWQKLHAHEKLRRVPLPSYPFERHRHWIDDADGHASDASHAAEEQAGAAPAEPASAALQLSIPSWTRRTEPVVPSGAGAAPWLLLLDRGGWGESLADAIRSGGGELFVARAGRAFEQRTERDFVLDPCCPEQARRLVEELQSRGVSPRQVVHLAGLDRPPEGAAAERWTTFVSLAVLLAALGRLSVPPARLTVVARSGHSVTGEEDLSPESAALYGLVRAAGLEQRAMSCRSVDVSERELERAAWLSDRLLAEARSIAPPLVAYRGQHRWEMTFEAPAPQGTPSAPGLRRGGRYVVVGESQGAGAAVVQHLSRVVGSAPILIDAAADLERCFRQAEQQLGGLDGVVYAAGVEDPRLLGAIGDLQLDAVVVALARHAAALSALERALSGRKLDFCLVFSSLSSLVAGAGFGAYAACNLLGDSLVRRHNQRVAQPWTLVNFDRWLEGPSLAGREGVQLEQALRALERLAQRPELEQVVVTAGALAARLARVEAQAQGSAPSDAHAAPVATGKDDRPLSTPYVGPRDEVEASLVAIWQELLGIRRIGVEDDFFDLGGHSLLATRFLVRLEEGLGLRVTIADFFAHPTPAELATLCRDIGFATTSPAELSLLLTQLEEMSESAARAELELVSVFAPAPELERASAK